jgi:hypothetical protein
MTRLRVSVASGSLKKTGDVDHRHMIEAHLRAVSCAPPVSPDKIHNNSDKSESERLSFEKKHTILRGGSLGSWIDEERSQLRELM